MSIKEKALRAIQDLPEDADYQAVAERLDFIKAVDEGLRIVIWYGAERQRTESLRFLAGVAMVWP